jgi:hypothetical protein
MLLTNQNKIPILQIHKMLRASLSQLKSMKITPFLLAIFLLSCNPRKDPLSRALASKNEKIKRVMSNLEQYRPQILFTEIKHTSAGVTFTDYSFQVRDSAYFYPASTVKFPIALLALEKMNEEKTYTRNTRFYVEGDTLITTFAREIEKIFAVSDNDAYNRLFEYLGQDEILKRLNQKGLQARISHRLSAPDADNVTTKPLIFYLNDSTTTPTQPYSSSPIKSLQLKNILTGKGYIDEGLRVEKPKDFSKKNYLPLSTLHDILKRLFFPEIFSEKEQFHLSKDDRDFIIQAMKTLPRQVGYSSEEYYDSYVKFFIYGDSKAPIDSQVELYNKAGEAYGYLTDCAYIVDRKRKKEYLLTATIYVNKDGIFNDDVYEYEEIGIPFLAELGRQLTTAKKIPQ